MEPEGPAEGSHRSQVELTPEKWQKAHLTHWRGTAAIGHNMQEGAQRRGVLKEKAHFRKARPGSRGGAARGCAPPPA